MTLSPTSASDGAARSDGAGRSLGAIATGATLAATVIVLLAIFVLRARHLFTTGFWNVDSTVVGLAFAGQLAALALGLVALQLVPRRWARAVIYVEGAICLCAYGPLVGAAYAATLLVYFVALELPLPRPARVLLPIAWLLVVGLGGDQWLSRELLERVFLFSMLFHVRMLVYAWEKWQSGFPRGRLADYALYFLSPPLLVFPPYVAVIPFYGRHASKFAPRLDRARAVAGVRHLGWGFAWTGAWIALEWTRRIADIRGPSSLPETYFLFVLTVVKLAGLVHLVHGLLTLHGFVDRAPIAKPLLSRTYVEFWQRFQIHQKDLQVAFFYNPVLLRLRRGNRYVAIAAAAAMTMLVGNFALHYLVRYVYAWHRRSAHWQKWLLFDVASFVALTLTLWLAEWRARTRHPVPKGAFGELWMFLSWLLTFTFTAYLIMM